MKAFDLKFGHPRNSSHANSTKKLVKSQYLLRAKRELFFFLPYQHLHLAHACASSGVNSLIVRYIGAPIYRWDALICPSKSIRSAVQSLLKTHQDMVYSEFGIKAECPIQLPIIPIGVDTQKFDNNKNLGSRAAIRNILGTSDDTIVILYVGRLNFISKSNLLPLALSAKEVATQPNKKIRL